MEALLWMQRPVRNTSVPGINIWSQTIKKKTWKKWLQLPLWRYMTSDVHWIITKYLSSWNKSKRLAGLDKKKEKEKKYWEVWEFTEIVVVYCNPFWSAAHVSSHLLLF